MPKQIMLNDETNAAPPRAFAVWFKDFKSWDVQSAYLGAVNKIFWPTVPLSSLCRVRFEPVQPEQLQTGSVHMLDRISFDEGKVFAGKRVQTRMTQHLARPGDIVVSKINARKKAIGIVPIEQDIGTSIHFRALIPDLNLVNTQFLWAALRSSFCTNQFAIQTGGIGKGEISEAALMNIEVPLPPLPIQQAIVAHWEAAQAEMQAIQTDIAALEGTTSRLVLDALGIPSQEMRALPKAFGLAWKDMERWSVGYIRRDLQGASGFTKTKYPIHPLSTCLMGTSNGYSIKPVATITPHKILKLNSLADAGLDLAQTKYVDVGAATAARFSLLKGDLLICRSVGSYSHIAKCALVEEDHPAILFPDIIIRVRFQERVVPEYVREVIQSSLGRAYFQANARTSVGMWKIGAEDIRNFPIPLPPLEVQREIVFQVQAQRAEVARLRAEAMRITQEGKAAVEAMILGTADVAAARE